RDLPDPDKRVGDRISKLKKNEVGSHRILSLTQNGKSVNVEVTGTVAKVQLAEPIQPGASATFEMTFESQVPVQIRRSGRNNKEGIDYTMTQWYPKMAEYDTDGWHPDQYVGREFYAPYGTFDVTINIHKDFTLGGTGVLINAEELGYGYFDGKVKKQKSKMRSWNFKAENVHDFAWAADKDYTHRSFQVENGPMVHLLYSEKTANVKNWDQLDEYVIKYFQFMEEKFGKYPYPQFSIIQGGDGGMEYPMCTMMLGGGKSLKGLVGLFVHEATHNWYYGILGSNENRYPWMDEGFTSFAEEEYMNAHFNKEKKVNPHTGAYGSYLYLNAVGDTTPGLREPMNIAGDFFNTNKMYSFTAYPFGQLFVNQVRYIVGEEAFWNGMKTYFDTWKFKHPDYHDFIRIMEVESDMELDWFPQMWLNTTRKIDYGIKEVVHTGTEGKLILEKKGDFMMPVDVYISLKNGDVIGYTIPLVLQYGWKEDFGALPAWPWTNRTYEWDLPYPVDQIETIAIDPMRMMCDTDLENNTWEAK
ncbi:MAG: M1 family metallopeptidase, partial [Schleiferiaceae bacterium]|nr:M1 family metallopeptidase [Schleiferiaceae bacterium]